jgi:hypothetical protein
VAVAPSRYVLYDAVYGIGAHQLVATIEVFLPTGLTNAATEGTNRLIKQVKRAACGFRNRENYRRRVRLHCTRRTRRLSARNPTVPAQS